MELLHAIIEELGFPLCLGGIILIYAQICKQHRDIKYINGKLEMIRLYDLRRIREELAEKKKDSAVEFTKVYRDANMGEYERLNKCKHEHVVEDFDIDINVKYYVCLDCGEYHFAPFGTMRNRGELRDENIGFNGGDNHG